VLDQQEDIYVTFVLTFFVVKRFKTNKNLENSYDTSNLCIT